VWPVWLKPWEWPERVVRFFREWHAMREAAFKAEKAKIELANVKNIRQTKDRHRDVAEALAVRRIVGATLDELCEWLPKYTREEIYEALCFWEQEEKAHRQNQGRWVWGPPPEWSSRFQSRLLRSRLFGG